MPKIIVHEKVLGHLSRGLYKSPASVLRELVSNAWDANATEVRIDTNYRLFFQVAISDNGDGFSKEEFRQLMGGGIGDSHKRADERKLIYDRPIIGRLGIGMLSIAQICLSFTITSKPRHGEGFRAKVRLYDLLKERLDRDDDTVVRYEDSTPDDDDSDVKRTVVNVGRYDFDPNFDPTTVDFGTLIIADQVHPQFTESFQESIDPLKFEDFREPIFVDENENEELDLEVNGRLTAAERIWISNLRVVQKVHSLQQMGDYWRLLLELSAACPVPYVTTDAVPEGAIAEYQKKLKSYRFKVILDGIRLFKPVYLKGNLHGYTTLKIETQSKRLYGEELKFDGYLVIQEAKNILPAELRGILVRIKNVGIGYYDSSMLDYRFNEGPRNNWLTGEINVQEGLENALNLDRDSFNRFHPEFRELQKYVHSLLRTFIFPEVYKKIEQRSIESQKKRDTKRLRHFQETVSKQYVIEPRLSPVDHKRPAGSSQSHQAKKRSTYKIPSPETLDTKKSNRQLASAIIGIYELSQRESTKAAQRATFTRLLLELLKKW